MSKVEEKLELHEFEEDQVFQWRYHVLLREGLDDLEATVVALGTFDLHRAIGMVRAGCTGEQLAEIAS